MANVNWLAILVSAISAMVWGYLWYGPLFGKPWMKLVGLSKADINKDKANMPKNYGMMFVGALVTSYVLDVTIGMSPMRDLSTGLTIALWLWLGFVAAVRLSDVIFNKKPWNLYFIEVGYYLAFLLTAGAILGSWA